ncbi:MAG: DUF4276 family protein [Acidimicrobiales bacterium]
MLAEGQTEEAFLRDTLGPHFADRNLATTPIIVATKRLAAGGKRRGGIGSWEQVHRELRRLLRDTHAVAVSTMMDLYGLPTAWPGASSAATEPRQRVAALEVAMSEAVDDVRFIPHLMLHEFEALVFACPDQAAAVSGNLDLAAEIRADVVAAGSPELVDDGPQTAPSKRLQGYWNTYAKTTDGPTIVQRAGLTALRSGCEHFGAWLTRLEAL